MLIRIVKLTFKPENIASFERIFEESKNGIFLKIANIKTGLLIVIYEHSKLRVYRRTIFWYCPKPL